MSLVISFNRTTDAMAFEEFCLKENIDGRLIPLPKEIDAGCGLAWKTKVDMRNQIEKTLNALNIQCNKIAEILI